MRPDGLSSRRVLPLAAIVSALGLQAAQPAAVEDLRAVLDGRTAQAAECRAPFEDPRCRVASLVRSATTGTGRELVAALADGAIAPEIVWELDALELGVPTVGARVLVVLGERARHGDCAASQAILHLVRGAPAGRSALADGAAWRVVGRAPDAVRACWPVYRELVPLVMPERVSCAERERVLAAYGACVCRSVACREVHELAEKRLRCANERPLPAPACE
jgi:hypothetical protein